MEEAGAGELHLERYRVHVHHKRGWISGLSVGCVTGIRSAKEAYSQAVALAAGSVAAQGLLSALVASLPVDLVIHAVAFCIIAIHKQLPADTDNLPDVSGLGADFSKPAQPGKAALKTSV